MSTSTSTWIPAATPTSATVLINIKDIKGRQLPNAGILKRLDKFHVDFVIDGELKHKTSTAKGNAVSWTESFCFDALGSSMLECRIYKHRVGSDSLIGATNGTIESLLAEGTVGAISRYLFKYDDHGNQTRTQTIVEFTISKASKAAAGLNMKQAVVQGKDALDHMKSAPSSVVEPIQGATDASTTVTNNIKSVSDTWGPLLQKIKLFSELVDKIAEVHPYAKMAWSILSATHKTILAQVDRDNRIVHLVEVIDDVYSFVEEADPIKKIESQHRIVALMAQQTTECAYFIRDYATHKSFWERTNEQRMSLWTVGTD